MEAFIQNIFSIFGPYQFFIPFFGSMVGGEETVVLISMLSAKGVIPFWVVLSTTIVGTILSDSVWYYLARTRVWQKFIVSKYFAGSYAKIATIVNLVTRGSHFRALLYTKFLYGTRIITIMYLSREHLSFKQFSAYNSVVTVIWATVVCTTGWLAGKGLVVLAGYVTDVQIIITLGVAFLIIFYFVRIWINKRLQKKRVELP